MKKVRVCLALCICMSLCLFSSLLSVWIGPTLMRGIFLGKSYGNMESEKNRALIVKACSILFLSLCAYACAVLWVGLLPSTVTALWLSFLIILRFFFLIQGFLFTLGWGRMVLGWRRRRSGGTSLGSVHCMKSNIEPWMNSLTLDLDLCVTQSAVTEDVLSLSIYQTIIQTNTQF